MEAYEASVSNVVTPTCGDLLLRDFTVRRCNRILADNREQRSLAAARKARSVLSLIGDNRDRIRHPRARPGATTKQTKKNVLYRAQSSADPLKDGERQSCAHDREDGSQRLPVAVRSNAGLRSAATSSVAAVSVSVSPHAGTRRASGG